MKFTVVVEFKSLSGFINNCLDILNRNGEFFSAGLVFEVLFVECAYAVFALCNSKLVREDLHLNVCCQVEGIKILFFKLTDSFVVSCD